MRDIYLISRDAGHLMKMRDCPSECGTVDTYESVPDNGKYAIRVYADRRRRDGGGDCGAGLVTTMTKSRPTRNSLIPPCSSAIFNNIMSSILSPALVMSPPHASWQGFRNKPFCKVGLSAPRFTLISFTRDFGRQKSPKSATRTLY